MATGIEIDFAKAKRAQTTARIAIMGAPGSGRLLSALKLARGLTDKPICVFDTEGGASVYADVVEFYTVQVAAPYTVEVYAAALKEAERAGFGALIFYNVSTLWREITAVVDGKARQAGGTTASAWREGDKLLDRFMQRVNESTLHVILVTRNRTETVVESASSPVLRLAAAPVQRETFLYEVPVVLEAMGGGVRFAVVRSVYPSLRTRGLIDVADLIPVLREEYSKGVPFGTNGEASLTVSSDKRDAERSLEIMALAGRFGGASYADLLQSAMKMLEIDKSLSDLTVGDCRELKLHLLGVRAFGSEGWKERRGAILESAKAEDLRSFADLAIDKIAARLELVIGETQQATSSINGEQMKQATPAVDDLNRGALNPLTVPDGFGDDEIPEFDEVESEIPS